LSHNDIDFAFIVLDGALSLLAEISTATLNSNTDFLGESGYHTYATTLGTSGSHTIGIGVVDANIDRDGNSAVLVDNFFVQKIPEPASLFVMALGLIVMVRIGRTVHANTHPWA
jgi:PEP-CTERM motif